MIVNDFNVLRTLWRPNKTNTPLTIDTNAVLPLAVTLQRLEHVPRWRSQICKRNGVFEYVEFSGSNARE